MSKSWGSYCHIDILSPNNQISSMCFDPRRFLSTDDSEARLPPMTILLQPGLWEIVGASRKEDSLSEVNASQLVCNKEASVSPAVWMEKMRLAENMMCFTEPWETGANMHVSQAQIKPNSHFGAGEWQRYWCELTDQMLFSEAVTSKQRFMQSSGVSGVRVEGGWGVTVILICPARHSNRERSDTSINSPSSTKFTLVFRKAQYFISSCRISQSYFQSLTCHHGVAVRQLVVIMTIYSPGSEGAALPSAPLSQPALPQPKQSTVVLLLLRCILSYFPTLFRLFSSPPSVRLLLWNLLQVCPPRHLCLHPFIHSHTLVSVQKTQFCNFSFFQEEWLFPKL